MSWEGSLSAENLIWGRRSATSFSVVRFSFFFYVSKSSIVPGLISWAKKLKISETFLSSQEFSGYHQCFQCSAQPSLMGRGWMNRWERLSNICVLPSGNKELKGPPLRGKTKGHAVIKWHQKSPMLRWSSKMNHRLQWSKVSNEWVVWEKGSWREWGWRRGNGDFSFCDSGS